MKNSQNIEKFSQDREELIQAIRDGNKEKVKLLLDKVEDLNIFGKDGNPPLFEAIYHGHAEIALLLLSDRNIDPNVKDKWGNNIIDWCVLNGVDPEIYKKLTEKNFQKTFEGKVHLYDYKVQQLFEFALYSERITEFKKLLKEIVKKTNIRNRDGKTILHIASENSNIEAVKAALEAGVDPNICDFTGKNTLYNQPYDIAKLLIEKGVEVNKCDYQGNNALIAAAYWQDLKLCKFLIDNGADPYIKNSQGKTAYDQLVFPSQIGYGLILIKNGVEKFAKNIYRKIKENFTKKEEVIVSKIEKTENNIQPTKKGDFNRAKNQSVELVGQLRKDGIFKKGSSEIDKNSNKVVKKVKARSSTSNNLRKN